MRTAVVAQERQQAGAQEGVAIVAAFACLHAQAHAVTRAVDVIHAQSAGLAHAQAAGVQGGEQHAVAGVGAAGQESGDFCAGE